MATLTPEQQAQLDALNAEAARPEPRAETGVAGLLHALIDSASGEVAHRGPDEWAALHRQAEDLAEPEPEAPPAGGTEESGFNG